MNLREMAGIRYIGVIALTLLIVSCGNKTKADESDADSLNEVSAPADSLALQADGVEDIAPTDLWTEDAVKADVKKMYDRLNQMAKAGKINLTQMDEEFCTGYYLHVSQAIAAHDANARGDMRFYGDGEGYRWLTDLAAPLTIEKINAELLTGNMARAQVSFKTDPKEEQKGFMALDLWMENGHWRVNNFDEPEAFGTGGYLGMMEKYVSDNNIHVDEDEPTEGAPM